MNKSTYSKIMLAAMTAALAGCAMFRESISDQKPMQSKTLTASYDQRDLLSWTDEMAKLILAQFPAAGEDRPILAVFPIQNRTMTPLLDTQALADTISIKLLDSGKIQLTNTTRRDELLKEQGYQLANVTPETRVQIGRQLGAKYMLTGSLIEIGAASGHQVRVSRKDDVYYQMTVEITDLQTGLVVLKKQLDRMRQSSKPIIGW